MTHRDDEAVRAVLGELRVEDELQAPAFDAVRWRRGSARPTRIAASRMLAIAASIVVVAAGTYGVVVSRRARLTVPKEVMALSAWRPATDLLLETPGRDLLRHAPRLGASLIDVPTTGDFR